MCQAFRCHSRENTAGTVPRLTPLAYPCEPTTLHGRGAIMQLSDEAVTAIELWAKGFNTLIEDFIAHKERVRSNEKRLEAMG